MIKTKYIKENDTYAIAPWYLSYFVDLDSKKSEDYDYPILGRLEPFSLEVFYKQLEFIFECYALKTGARITFIKKASSCKEYSINLKKNLISLEFSIDEQFINFIRAMKYDRKTNILIRWNQNSITKNYPKAESTEFYEEFEVILKDETTFIVNIMLNK